MRVLTKGAAEIALDAATVGDALDALEARHPGFRDRLFDAEGNLHRFVNVFVADAEVRTREGLATVLDSADLSIVPAVAGG